MADGGGRAGVGRNARAAWAAPQRPRSLPRSAPGAGPKRPRRATIAGMNAPLPAHARRSRNAIEDADAGAVAGLFALPSPFPTELGTVRLLEAPDRCAATLAAQLVDGSYPKPFLLDQDGYRYLHFSLRFQQTGMRIAAPHALELAYTQGMMAFLLFNPRPRALLLVGLGGGSLIKFCHRHLPATDLTALEIDPTVIGFRDAFHIPPDDARFRVIEADGVRFAAEDGGRSDVILVDAFDPAGVACALAGSGFYDHLYRRLSGNGVLVMNIAGDREDYAVHVGEIADAFDDRLLAMSVRDDGNYLLFAFKNPRFEPRWKWMRAIALELQGRLGLDFPTYAEHLERGQKLRLAQRMQR